ncbi:uncharacterized protein LOC100369221 [Saccoglossus kowalevskii]
MSTKIPTTTIDTTSPIPPTINILTTKQGTTSIHTEEVRTNTVTASPRTTTEQGITSHKTTGEPMATIISTMPPTTSEVTTQPGSPYIDVNCNRYSVGTEKRTWHASKSQCEFMGGVLASLHTQSVFQNVRTFIMNGNFDNGVRGYWIGLNDLSTEGTFEWLNGDVFGWTAWAKGEPNNKVQQSGEGQDCVQVWKKRAYKWDDNNCNAKRGYICQTPIPGCFVSTEVAPITTNSGSTESGTTNSISTEESPTTIFTSALPTTEVITTKPEQLTTNVPTTEPGSTPISTEQVRTNIVTTGPATISTKEPSTTIFTTTSEPLTRNVLTTEPVTTQPISTEEPTPNVVTTTLVPLTTNVHTKKPVTSSFLSTEEPTTTIVTTTSEPLTTNLLTTKSGSTPISPEQVRTNIITANPTTISTKEPATTIFTTTSEPLSTNVITSEPVTTQSISTKEPRTTIDSTSRIPPTTNMLTTEQGTTQSISTEESTTNIVTPALPNTEVITMKPVTTQSITTEEPTTTIDTTSPIPPTTNKLTTEQETTPHKTTGEQTATIISTNMPPTTNEVTIQPGLLYIDVNCDRYNVVTEKRTWHASKSHCESMGGVLASLHTQSVFQNVRTFIMNSNFDNDVRGYWIGLNDLSTEGSFEWLNGDVFGWTAWAKGQPNSNVQQSVQGQDCVQVW